MALNSPLRVKAILGEEIRKFTVDTPTYQAVYNVVLELFKPEGALRIKYKDQEGDLVTISSDGELEDAAAQSKLCPTGMLRLCLFPAPPPCPSTLKPSSDVEISKQLPPSVPATTLPPAPCPQVASPQQEHSVHPGLMPFDQRDPRLAPPSHHDPRVYGRGGFHGGRGAHRGGRGGFRGGWFGPAAGWNEGCEYQYPGGKKCKLSRSSARLVRDVTVKKNEHFQPGTSFVKTWRFRNDSTEPWPSGSVLQLVSKRTGDQMGAPTSVPAPPALPGQEVDISVPMIAPDMTGKYSSHWRLSDPTGVKFGQRVKVSIRVVSSEESSSDTSDGKTKQYYPGPVVIGEINPELRSLVEEMQLDLHNRRIARLVARGTKALSNPALKEAKLAIIRQKMMLFKLKQQKKVEKKAAKEALKAAKALQQQKQ